MYQQLAVCWNLPLWSPLLTSAAQFPGRLGKLFSLILSTYLNPDKYAHNWKVIIVIFHPLELFRRHLHNKEAFPQPDIRPSCYNSSLKRAPNGIVRVLNIIYIYTQREQGLRINYQICPEVVCNFTLTQTTAPCSNKDIHLWGKCCIRNTALSILKARWKNKTKPPPIFSPLFFPFALQRQFK